MINRPDVTTVPCVVAREEGDVDQSKVLARLEGRVDLLAERERARQALRIFSGGPAPEFQGNLRRRARY